MAKSTKKRRGVGLEGAKRPEPQPADLNPMSGVPPEARMRSFLQGDLQLADVFELTHEELYKICARGQTLYEAGKIEDAEKIFEALTALAPYDANFHVGLGVVYQRQKRLRDALREFDRAISANQRFVPALALRAEVLLELGDLTAASRDLERVMELDPRGTSGHTQRAMGMALAVSSMAKELAEKGPNVELPPPDDDRPAIERRGAKRAPQGVDGMRVPVKLAPMGGGSRAEPAPEGLPPVKAEPAAARPATRAPRAVPRKAPRKPSR